MHAIRHFACVAICAAAALFAVPPAVAQADAHVHVRLTTRIVVMDREAVTRAGLSYLVLASDRVRLDAGDRRPARRGSGGPAAGVLGVRAFLDAARDRRWVRAEHTQQIVTLSGTAARISSTELEARRYGTRSSGPATTVVPTVLPDGRVRLWISTGVEDRVVDAWGRADDGDPVAAEAEIVARPGEEVILASGASVETAREAGLLRLRHADRGRDVLVVVTAEILADLP
jgi:hypothetical protein